MMESHTSKGITILGLGPGDPGLITRQAWELLQQSDEVHLRTHQHPAVAGLPKSVTIHTFDELYEKEASFEAVYEGIVARVIELGGRPEGVVYAVPGHPFVAEATVPEIARRARQQGIPVRIIEGLSFLEPVLAAIDVDPFPHTAMIDALELARLHVPPFSPSAPALVAQMHSRAVASEVKLTLMSVYPDEHPVKLVHAAGTLQVLVEPMPLYGIDRSTSIGLLTALYVPALGHASSFEAFQEIIAHLRAPDGCPWDKEQTHQTLRSHLLEEAYEVLSALDADDPEAMREELGDLLLQIVLHAQIASEYGEFNMADILERIHAKIVRRHPHVFGSADLKDVQSVLQNWERLKEVERNEFGKEHSGLLQGVALALPALIQAQEYQSRAARVGFDWTDIQGVVDKIYEELKEIQNAGSDAQRAGEVGDLLFAAVNLARWLGVDAESTLREANARFRERFARIEAAARAQSQSISDMSLDEMEALWQEAKK
jgi:tetrapyrrole methylase family protein/MazG family protein